MPAEHPITRKAGMMKTRSERPAALALLWLASVALSACGSGTATSATASGTSASKVQITPTASDVSPGGVVKFQAMTEGTSGVPVGGSLTLTVQLNGAADAGTWSVEEGVAGGSVNASGLYVAPQAPGTYHVLVASIADPSQSDRATITVASAQPPPVPPPPAAQVVVAISPAAVIVPAGQAVQLSAGVSGSSDTAVSWSVAEGSS